MKEITSKNSKLIGVIIGLIIGTLIGVNMQSEEYFSKIQESYLVIFLYLNLITPALFVYRNLKSKKSISINETKKLNSYINVYFFSITVFLTSSMTRWITVENLNPDNGFDLMCKIYASMGVGFFIAYNVENFIRKKYMKNA